MHLDEYRAGFEHRTRSNRPQCRHVTVSERSRAGRLVERVCLDCGVHLPDREWEDQ